MKWLKRIFKNIFGKIFRKDEWIEIKVDKEGHAEDIKEEREKEEE